MTPPPTSIDGTDITGATIDGQEVQEITIDGQPVFNAGPPQNVVDDFEDSNLSEYTDTSDFSIVSNDVLEGSRSLSMASPASNVGMYSLSGNGLEFYPGKGDKFSVLLIDPNADLPGFNFGLFDDSGFISGYSFIHFPNDSTFVLLRLDQGTINEIGGRQNIGLTNSQIYDYEVQWHDGSGSEPNNTIELTIFEVDGSANLSEELGRTSQVHNFTISDSTYPNGRGVGFTNGSGAVDGTGRMDRWWYLGDVE